MESIYEIINTYMIEIILVFFALALVIIIFAFINWVIVVSIALLF